MEKKAIYSERELKSKRIWEEQHQSISDSEKAKQAK